MSVFRIGRRYLRAEPAAALGDVLGLVTLCGLVFAGLVLPGLF